MVHEKPLGVRRCTQDARVPQLPLQVQVAIERSPRGLGSGETSPAAFQRDSSLCHTVGERPALFYQRNQTLVEGDDLVRLASEMVLHGPGVCAHPASVRWAAGPAGTCSTRRRHRKPGVATMAGSRWDEQADKGFGQPLFVPSGRPALFGDEPVVDGRIVEPASGCRRPRASACRRRLRSSTPPRTKPAPCSAPAGGRRSPKAPPEASSPVSCCSRCNRASPGVRGRTLRRNA